MNYRNWLRLEWDRALAIMTATLGVVVLVVGWFKVSDTPYPAEQLPLILSSGIGGMFLLGLAATLWLSGDLTDEWRKLDSIDEALRDLSGTTLVAAAPDAESSGSSRTNGAHHPCDVPQTVAT